jgi:hypothetical protein
MLSLMYYVKSKVKSIYLPVCIWNTLLTDVAYNIKRTATL